MSEQFDIASRVIPCSGAVRLKLHLHPGAKRNSISGNFGDAVKVDLQTPPVEGKANAALIKILAQWLDIPRSRINLISGQTNRNKIVEISGATPQEIIAKLEKQKS